MTTSTKFFAHLRGDDISVSPVVLKAQSMPEAKTEVWNLYGDGFRHHWVEICEAMTFDPGRGIEAGRALLMRRISGRSWQVCA